MHNPALRNFVPTGPGMYSFSDMHVPPRLYSATREQVKSYIAYDSLLRSGENRANHPVPLGYDEFAYIFNFNEPDVLVKFTTIEGDDVVKINGPAVTTPFLVGEDENTLPAAGVQPAVIAKEVPRDPDGGRWLNQRKAALVDDTLWDNLARSHRQNRRRDEAVQARKDKRRTPYAPPPPHSPAPNNQHTPTNRSSGSGASTSGPSREANTEQDDVSMEGMEDRDTVAEGNLAAKKGKGRKN